MWSLLHLGFAVHIAGDVQRDGGWEVAENSTGTSISACTTRPRTRAGRTAS